MATMNLHVMKQVKEALERKKMERLESDERMRKPWQQPPPPKKEILRAKQKQKPVPLPSPAKPRIEPRDENMGEDRRKEWREGLKAHIEAARASQHRDSSPTPAAALTWQELRMAAEAGFDELIRHEEKERDLANERAAFGFGDGTLGGGGGGGGGRNNNRSPYRNPAVMQRAMAAAANEAVHVTLLPATPSNKNSPQRSYDHEPLAFEPSSAATAANGIHSSSHQEASGGAGSAVKPRHNKFSNEGEEEAALNDLVDQGVRRFELNRNHKDLISPAQPLSTPLTSYCLPLTSYRSQSAPCCHPRRGGALIHHGPALLFFVRASDPSLPTLPFPSDPSDPSLLGEGSGGGE